MIGNHAFCGRSGAPLSEETYYDDGGNRRRFVLARECDDECTGELTTGEVRSSARALVTYFRRSHRTEREYDPELYRRAALAVRRLKRAAGGTQEADRHVWFALRHRLERTGHDADWMIDYVDLRCPDCHGRLRFERDRSGDVVARCGTNCDGRSTDRVDRVRETVVSLYADAFDDRPPEVDELVQFA